MVEDVDGAIDDHVSRRLSEARHARVVPDLEDERTALRPIRAGLEQQRIALAPELVVDLLGRHGIYSSLDRCLRHVRIEDQHVRAKIRRPG